MQRETMFMGWPIGTFPWTGERGRSCNVGRVALPWHQYREIRQICRWHHVWMCKFLHRPWIRVPIDSILMWRKRSIWPEQMFKYGHDKKHWYQDCCGNKAERNCIHGCSKVLPWSLAVSSCLGWARVWARINVPWLWSFGIEFSHICRWVERKR